MKHGHAYRIMLPISCSTEREGEILNFIITKRVGDSSKGGGRGMHPLMKVADSLKCDMLHKVRMMVSISVSGGLVRVGLQRRAIQQQQKTRFLY
ncbi:hypothetical protein CDAR_599521 [Caerostris darwini]|uniref:Uncharacterized protein n=1 Tax=Caerostris darwini TaxID=1538125 RepID=A0AAV4NW37_9ARAC|nr:hypothetical protein CDAR_599521 [Caerostris darwini]